MKTKFRVSRTERAGVLIWLALVLLLYQLPEWLSPGPQYEDAAAFRAELAALRAQNPGFDAFYEKKSVSSVDSPPGAGTSARLGDPFFFDPNTASEDELARLGLPKGAVRGIVNYREKGGRFRRPEDFGKIYALPKADFERLLPYVRISGANENPFPSKKTRRTAPLDINSASAEEWAELPGIGPGYAARIVRFRDALGGFVDTAQVAETFGLPDSVYRRIASLLVSDGRAPRTLDPNRAEEEALEAHPYISPAQARAVVRYRERSGGFPSVDALQILSVFRDGKIPFFKIKPYLQIQ
jgi:DNA uptake protein ComE-like DNA-binding protein